MDKAVAFLEKHAQWVALGIAAAWLGFIAYSYYVVSPVTVQVNGKEVAPGDADNQAAAVTAQIVAEMKNSDHPAEPPKRSGDDLIASLDNSKSPPIVNYNPFLIESQPATAIRDDGVIPTTNQRPTAIARATNFPAVPRFIYTTNTTGTSQVKMPVAAQGAPADAPPAEVTWASLFGHIDIKPTIDSYAAANIPEALRWENPIIVRIEVERQYLDSSGTPIKVEAADHTMVDTSAVESLKHATPEPLDDPAIYNLPADPARIATLVDWAKANQEKIVRPEFYPLAGSPFREINDPWETPEDREKNLAAEKALPDESVAPKVIKPKEPKEPKKAPTPIAPKPRPAAYQFGSSADTTFPIAADAPKPLRNPDGSRIPGSNPPSRTPSQTPPRQPTQQPQPPVQQPPVQQPPAQPQPDAGAGAPFVPVNLDEVWAHDDNLSPGNSVRYRFRVVIVNPLFGRPDLCDVAAKDKHLSEYPLLPAQPTDGWSDWTPPITIPLRTPFFFTKGPVRLGSIIRPDAEVEVFDIKGGGVTRRQFSAGPGDIIPGSALVIVDIRPIIGVDGKDDFAITLVDGEGHTAIHTIKGDDASPLHRRLTAFVKQASAPTTAN